jgi:hypothetical protein
VSIVVQRSISIVWATISHLLTLFFSNAWSKSGARDAAKRGEDILDRMESLYEQGRKEMQPNTTSFNTVIDALARSGERGSEHRAEDLLERMEELSNRHAELKDTCKPNHVVSFMTSHY